MLNPDPAAMERGRKPRYQLDPGSDAWTREMQPEKQNPAYELPEFLSPGGVMGARLSYKEKATVRFSAGAGFR